MPTYDYTCPGCGGFDALRSMGERDLPVQCPSCGALAPRVLVSAPRLALLAGSTRAAMGVNERARHEPQSSRDYQRLRHPAGCGCCAPGKRGATVTAPNGAKGFPSKRPWMISH
jgi:putative FmdB family regulatory protein